MESFWLNKVLFRPEDLTTSSSSSSSSLAAASAAASGCGSLFGSDLSHSSSLNQDNPIFWSMKLAVLQA
jgi:hypothetical protein